MYDTKPDFTQDKPITIGEMYGYGMTLTDPVALKAYFEECVQHVMGKYGQSREEAERIQRINFSYYAGYYGYTEQKRVERVLGAVHPIFGSVANGPVTPEDAFNAGVKAARDTK